MVLLFQYVVNETIKIINMGVMSCSRRTCDNIMCNTYIDDVGYICWECQKEFETYLQKNDYNPTTALGIANHLKMFMKSDKSGYDNENEISVGEFFRNYTKDI